MESLVSDIPAGDGKTANHFLQCKMASWLKPFWFFLPYLFQSESRSKWWETATDKLEEEPKVKSSGKGVGGKG
jgi:hypothetical protein